ncbi:PDR/VanB family oxidoreductase [Actinophytocola sp.]|uniref:PDR/VanB family oxidoreductase n=1 Tax=Actinophytocola sp. TaxID=1872138 RepID=UPI002ED53D54
MIDVSVAAKEAVADGVVALTLRGSSLPSWTPGAHVDVELRSGLVRQYSLCGSPDDPSWRIGVLRESSGRGGSEYVHDTLAVGDRVRVSLPRNTFPLEPAARYLFIAGGIGITPLLPMIAAVAAQGADWQLRYGGRTRESMAFLPELAVHGDRVCARPGLIDLSEVDDDVAVYCCGPEPLLSAVEGRYDPDRLHLERFAPRPVAGAPFEVELASSGNVLKVPADQSILSVLLDAGVPVLSSCQEGTCGTCETEVLSGTPEHHDSLLTEEERASGETMMICVSRSTGGRLVLDL